MLIALWAVAVGALILALVALIDSVATRSEARQAVADLDGATAASLSEMDARLTKGLAEAATTARLALEKAEAAHSRMNGWGRADAIIGTVTPRMSLRPIGKVAPKPRKRKGARKP